MEQQLTLIHAPVARTADGHIVGLYRCTCGNQIKVAQSRVKNGYTKSCGCAARQESSERATKHGMRKSPEYSSWLAMKGRCCDPGNKDYPRWGGRGITVCKEWAASFEAFYSHIGPRPPGTSIDRLNGARGYEPGNVRWATPKEQARNRRDLVIVETPHGQMALVDYAKMLGITKGAAHLRLKRGKLEGAVHV